MITSRDAKSACSKGLRTQCSVIIFGVFWASFGRKDQIAWWMLPADLNSRISRKARQTCHKPWPNLLCGVSLEINSSSLFEFFWRTPKSNICDSGRQWEKPKSPEPESTRKLLNMSQNGPPLKLQKKTTKIRQNYFSCLFGFFWVLGVGHFGSFLVIWVFWISHWLPELQTNAWCAQRRWGSWWQPSGCFPTTRFQGEPLQNIGLGSVTSQPPTTRDTVGSILRPKRGEDFSEGPQMPPQILPIHSGRNDYKIIIVNIFFCNDLCNYDQNNFTRRISW